MYEKIQQETESSQQKKYFTEKINERPVLGD